MHANICRCLRVYMDIHISRCVMFFIMSIQIHLDTCRYCFAYYPYIILYCMSEDFK